MDTNHDRNQPLSEDLPLVLLASDDPRLATHLYRALREHGLAVESARGYREVETLAEAHQSAIVLLEVSRHESVESAVDIALRIKRRNAGQFVAYVADRALHNSGLAGDAIFPRNAHELAQALRNHFKNGK